MSRGIDFAPNEPHVFFRTPSRCYYSPMLFHAAPTVSICPPLFVHDIANAPALESIYGAKGYMSTRDGYTMLNNHPIQRFTVVGRVISQITVFKKEVEYICLRIDDSSGPKASITTLLALRDYIRLAGPRESLQGSLVEITGKLKDTSIRREISTVSARTLETGLEGELEHWRKCLEFRDQVLASPWVYDGARSVDLSAHDTPVIFEEEEVSEAVPPEAIRQVAPPHATHPQRQPQAPNAVKAQPEVIEISSEADSEDYVHVQEIETKEHITPVITEFQVTMEFIKILIEARFEPTKLVHIYNQPRVNVPLNDLVRYRLLTSHQEQTSKELKFEVFHAIRHNLQVHCNLIKVTKKQVVTADNLKKLYDILEDVLRRLTKDTSLLISVNIFLRALRTRFDWVGDGVDAKLINVIIDVILANDRPKFRYDSRRVEWSFAPND